MTEKRCQEIIARREQALDGYTRFGGADRFVVIVDEDMGELLAERGETLPYGHTEVGIRRLGDLQAENARLISIQEWMFWFLFALALMVMALAWVVIYTESIAGAVVLLWISAWCGAYSLVARKRNGGRDA